MKTNTYLPTISCIAILTLALITSSCDPNRGKDSKPVNIDTAVVVTSYLNLDSGLLTDKTKIDLEAAIAGNWDLDVQIGSRPKGQPVPVSFAFKTPWWSIVKYNLDENPFEIRYNKSTGVTEIDIRVVQSSGGQDNHHCITSIPIDSISTEANGSILPNAVLAAQIILINTDGVGDPKGTVKRKGLIVADETLLPRSDDDGNLDSDL